MSRLVHVFLIIAMICALGGAAHAGVPLRPLKDKSNKEKDLPPPVEINLDVLDAFAPRLDPNPLAGLPDVSNYHEPPRHYSAPRKPVIREQKPAPPPAITAETDPKPARHDIGAYEPPPMFDAPQESAQVNITAPSLPAVPTTEVYTQIIDGTPDLSRPPTPSGGLAVTASAVPAPEPVKMRKDIAANDLVQPTAKQILDSIENIQKSKSAKH